MIPDEQEFIYNIAQSLSTEVIDKLKKAHEYFREDTNVTEKCVTMHHLAICKLLADFILVMEDVSDLTTAQLFAILQADATHLVNKLKEQDGR